MSYFQSRQCACELATAVASGELLEKKQMGRAENCSDLELSNYLQALAEGCLVTYYSDTKPSARSKSISIASRSYRQGRQTVHFHGFPSLEMSQNLMDDRGADLLMSYLGDSRAKTSALPETGPDWTAKGQGYGQKWLGLLGRYDPDTHSLKTAQLSLLEDSTECCPTLPRWGLLAVGELYPQPMLELRTDENESGYWPTPTVCGNYNRPGASATAVKMWPTPQASDNRDRGNLSTPAIKRRIENGKQVMLSMCVSSENGRLNPDWVEWLMGWPIGHTDLKPLATDKFQEFEQQHGSYFMDDKQCA